MVKMIQTLVTLYDITANQTTTFYICSVFSELAILILVIATSPMTLHKLAPLKVAKQGEAKQTTAEIALKDKELPL